MSAAEGRHAPRCDICRKERLGSAKDYINSWLCNECTEETFEGKCYNCGEGWETSFSSMAAKNK
eukprot:3064788-Rhodomonas_salina.1